MPVPQMHTPMLTPTRTRQRHSGDCGIAALASFTGLSYEDVYMVAVQVDKRIPRTGATVTELVKVAKKLGRTLERVHWRKVDVECDEGILGITWNDPAAHNKVKGHWVLLLRGLIIDPWDTATVDADEYLMVNGGRVGTLLVETKKPPRRRGL